MQAIERIRAALKNLSAVPSTLKTGSGIDEYRAACRPLAMTEVLAHIDVLEAEVERLRKDAERYRWLRKTTNWVSSKGQRINVRDFPKSWDEHIDDAMKGTP